MKLWAFCVIVVSMVAAGCSGAEPATVVPVAYTEPGWMAEVRAQNEEYTQAGLACLRAAGYEAVEMGGSFALLSHDDPATGPVPEVVKERDTASQRCSDEAPDRAYLSNSPEVEYDRVLDLRACLIDQGYTMPEAPSREVWTEDFLSGSPWSPYLDEFDNNPAADAPHQYTTDEITHLLAVCTPSNSGSLFQYEE